MGRAELFGLLPEVWAIAEAAGRQIATMYESSDGSGVSQKADGSPVTEADLLAQDVIKVGLANLAGGLPMVSEEDPKSHQVMAATSPYWLVDPLDGTREYVQRTGQFTVNIALIQDGKPILGVIYVPTQRMGYGAARGCGAHRKGLEQKEREKIASRPLDPDQFVLLVSQRHDPAHLAKMKERWPQALIQPVGSSLKFCQIAEGQADLTVRRGVTREWDTAAGQILLEEAGGKILAIGDGQPLIYNKGHLDNPEFYAVGDRNWQFSQTPFISPSKTAFEGGW